MYTEYVKFNSRKDSKIFGIGFMLKKEFKYFKTLSERLFCVRFKESIGK